MVARAQHGGQFQRGTHPPPLERVTRASGATAARGGVWATAPPAAGAGPQLGNLQELSLALARGAPAGSPVRSLFLVLRSPAAVREAETGGSVGSGDRETEPRERADPSARRPARAHEPRRARARLPSPRRGRSPVQPPARPPAIRPAPLPGAVPVPKAARHRCEANGLGRAAARTRTRSPGVPPALSPALLSGPRPARRRRRRRRTSRHAAPARLVPPAAAAAAARGARLGAAAPGGPLGAWRRRVSGAVRAGALRPAAGTLRGRPRPRRVRLLRGVWRARGGRVRPAGGPVRRGAAVRGALRGARLGHGAAARAGRPLRVRQQRAGVRQRRQHLRQPVPAARCQPPFREAAPAAGHRLAARRLRPRYLRSGELPSLAGSRPAPAERKGQAGGGEVLRALPGTHWLGEAGTGPRGDRIARDPSEPSFAPSLGQFLAQRVPDALCPEARSQGDGVSLQERPAAGSPREGTPRQGSGTNKAGMWI